MRLRLRPRFSLASMRALLTTICTWILLASGSFLMVYGGMDYWAARQGQSEIAREWQNGDDQEHPVPGGAYDDSHGGGTAALTPQGTVPRVPPPTAGEPV